MTRPTFSSSAREATSPDLILPAIAPFDSTSDISTTSSQSKAGTRPNWSLWPLKTSSVILNNNNNNKNSIKASLPLGESPTSRDGIAYSLSNSPSPPSPFNVGRKSDSSPPATPPDSTFHLDTPKSGASRRQQQSQQQQLSPYSPSVSGISPSSSRNDIFSSPVASPIPAPAPRLHPSNVQGSVWKASTSRNANFFDSHSSLETSSPQQITSASSDGHRRVGSTSSTSDRPNYGRSNTEERRQERARIRQNNAVVDFRLCPVKDYLLGEGRHCTVYLGAYRTKRGESFEVDSKDSVPNWTLCAIKRLHSDRQSQLLGLEEAFALRRLGPHPNVVKLINVRDEVELTATSPMPMTGEESWSGVAVPVSLQGQERNQMQYNHIGKGMPSGNTTTSTHGRSTSESLASDFNDKSHTAFHTHRRLASSPARGPVVVVASPDGDDMYGSPIASEIPPLISEKDIPNADMPRLLILLEVLPYNLSSFARRNSDRVDYNQWKQWAIELAGVVEWLHSKGCVHADLKPENVLLTSDLKVKLCDFNSALFPSPSTLLTDGLGLGTPAYGAPELASSKGFSYPVDIWSLGAILYTLAKGVDSFRTARSMIDILHRKRVFFESEENDRIAALSVAEGRASSINGGGSTTTSRNGSLRGKKKLESDYTNATSRPTAALYRENSSDSISSIASSVMLSGSSGRNPSIRAISMLLEQSPPIGILNPPGCSSSSTSAFASSPMQQFKFGKGGGGGGGRSNVATSNGGAGGNLSTLGHHRATSLGKAQTNSLLSPNAARRATQVSRPTVLRRTTSYGGVDTSESIADDINGNNSIVAPETVIVTEEEQQHQNNADTSKRYSAELRLAVTAAFAQSARERGPFSENQEGEELGEGEQYLHKNDSLEEDEFKPYKDGSPALILPGGGRLPDEARNLLERMLNADADRRPTAAQVRRQLEML